MEIPPSSKDDILDNIDGRMHGPMSGFVEKFFGHFQYVHQDGFLEIQAAGSVRGRCVVPSEGLSPDKFLSWFTDHVAQELNGARGSWQILVGNGSAEHEDDSASLLLAIPPSATPDGQSETRWDHVQVVGQFERRGCVYQDGLVRLCRSAQQVFAHQPTRLFLHGFYMRHALVELWMFDRSGLYCSDVFDIRNDFLRVLSLLFSYQWMTDQELGLSNTIKTDHDGSYVVLDRLGKLYLETPPMASRKGLVGAGMTCYRAAKKPDTSRWTYVVKYKWRWARERPEDELLKRAQEKGVWGALSLEEYSEAESTAYLRRRLRWGKQRRFVETSDRSRKVHDGLADYTKETNNFFQNRILACIVTSPLGRSLDTFRSLAELLEVFRDAIRCHRSLYCDAQILHQDVSPGNMIILDEGEEEEEGKQPRGKQPRGKQPRGILIDLDSAVNESETEHHDIIGTRPFMALGVLRGEQHTYRHDLESFLYVFLWTVIANHAENPPKTSRLRQWSDGDDWDALAERKLLDMGQDGFQTILEEFAPEFHSLKSLAEHLRQILFPIREGIIWTGTDGSTEAVDKLYDEMIEAFQ